MKDFYYKQEHEYIVVLNECFASDQELLDKWHLCAPADLNTCVRRTYYDLKNAPSLKFFTLHCSEGELNELMGFYGTEHVDGIRFMTSFFLKPKYRTKETMEFFWDSVESETGIDFYTCIYSHNTRAQKFLERNDFTLIKAMNIGEKSDALVFQKN